jgi:hypothetical protein
MNRYWQMRFAFPGSPRICAARGAQAHIGNIIFHLERGRLITAKANAAKVFSPGRVRNLSSELRECGAGDTAS